MNSASSLQEDFELHCLDVGQGCSTVVLLPSRDLAEREALVIDSSDSVTTIECLERHSVTRLRLVLITHSDDDHARGIPAVLRRYAGRVSALAYNLDRATITDKQWQKSLLHVIKSRPPGQVYRTIDMAGTWARCCVICFAHEDIVTRCKQSIGSEDVFQIFGRQDVERWRNGDFNTLISYLNHSNITG